MDTNEFLHKQRQTYRLRKETYGYQKGKVVGWEKLAVFD